MLRALLLLVPGLLAAGCSSRTAPQDQRGPIWPDLRLDRRRADARRDAAPLPDLAAPDLPPPDSWPYDFRPEAQPNPTWSKVPLLTADDLHGVACVAGHVFAVGAQGTILHRGPADTAFQPQLLPEGAVDLRAVSFADASYGVVAGKSTEIWQTTDLGATWTIAPQCHATLLDTVYAFHLSGVGEGFAAGVAQNGEGALKYNNGGGGWTCTGTYPSTAFYGVFRQGTKGWAVGDTGGHIYYTGDAGVSWSPIAAGTSQPLRGLWFPSAGTGVAVGDGGVIVGSTDGAGLVWTQLSSPTSAPLQGLSFWDAQNGWAVGASGTILHSSDGGASWTTQPSGTTVRLEAVCFTSASEGWAVGEKGMLLHTTTGGL